VLVAVGCLEVGCGGTTFVLFYFKESFGLFNNTNIFGPVAFRWEKVLTNGFNYVNMVYTMKIKKELKMCLTGIGIVFCAFCLVNLLLVIVYFI